MIRTSLWLAGVALCAGGAPVQAKTCAVDLDQLKQIRADITDLVRRTVHLDRGQAKDLAGKYLEQLKTGKLVLDKRDLKGVVAADPKASAAQVQQLLIEVQTVVKSCEQAESQ